MNCIFDIIFFLIDIRQHGGKGGAVVRALNASHQCGPGSNPGIEAMCGLSLLLVLSLPTRGFSPGTPVFLSIQNPTLPNCNSIWNADTFQRVLKSSCYSKCSLWVNKLQLNLHASCRNYLLGNSTFSLPSSGGALFVLPF